MEYKLTLDKAIAFLRIYLTLPCCWPLPANATKLQRLRRSAFQYFCCLNSITLGIAAIWTICKYSDNTLVVLKLGCQLSAIIQIPFQLILFGMQSKRLQFIVYEMEDYYQKAEEYEKEIFQQYVNKCKYLYGSIICWLIIAGINVIIGPVFLPQPFPLETEYPFDVQYQPLKAIIYVHHALTVCQSVTQVSANTFPALLLWYVAARFDMLSIRFRAVTNSKELAKCTRDHLILLRYAKEVTQAIRYVALLCVTCSTGAVIFGFLTFMSHHPWSAKWTFLMIALGAFAELYMYAWPADNIITTSTNIAFATYDSTWYNSDLTTQKNLVQIILKSQHPVTVSIPFALPTLSMSYYTSYVSTVFSYMAIVRMLMEEK